MNLNLENVKLMLYQNHQKTLSITAKYEVGSYTDKKTGEEKPKYFKIRFIDSIRFMGKSLEKLVMYQEGNLPITKSFYTDEEFNILKRKGVFPYDWFNSLEKLKWTHLPSRCCFYSSLTGKECSKKDYMFAQLVWKKFN